MKQFWVSWYHRPNIGAFELHSPWWVSGYKPPNGDMDAPDEAWEPSVCAAVRAESEEAAQEAIYACYDVRPANLEVRFVEERDADWTPFCDRFRKADWMKW